jgi:hypothetical protein
VARIRTIKPEFWESESVGRLSFGARLLFLASLNFADDEGFIRWNEAYLSSQAFVYDESVTESISEWMDELVRESIVFPYRAGTTNQRLAWIISFRKHQVINRPQPSKLPPPSIQNKDFHYAIFKRDGMICHLCGHPIDNSDPSGVCGSLAGSIDHVTPKSKGGTDYPSNLRASHLSCNKKRGNRSLNDSVAEGNGREGKGENQGGPSGLPDCPHDDIIAAYHETLPTCPRVKAWTDKRRAALRARWRENAKHYVTVVDGVAWWRKFFAYVAQSDFLTGKTQSNGRAPFLADLEWLTNSSNFVKIIEGKYHA